MESSFNEFAKIITKHVLDDPQKLTELKERFEVLEHAQSKAGAAALGYLIGKAEKEEENSDVYDQTLNIIRENRENEWICADEIFTLIYKWLAKELEDNNVYASQGILRKAFEDFIIL
jgi:hypothetical protein